MAEYYMAVGNSVDATASLVLAYEFSENKEKTIAFFDGKANSTDQYASIYLTILKKLNDQSRSGAPEPTRVEITKPRNTKTITKIEARAILVDKLNSDADSKNDPVKKELVICMIEEPLNETFGNANELDTAIFEQRIVASMERMKTGMDNKDPDVTLKMMRCVINSSALDQAMKDKTKQEKSSTTTKIPTSPPLLDMDDLRLDIASLDGRKIRVRGIGLYMMDMFMLKKSMTDMSPIIVNISKLQREQRRQLIQQCSDIMSGCKVIVNGTVGKVSYQNGINAENIEW
jgi:hypothetical protein